MSEGLSDLAFTVLVRAAVEEILSVHLFGKLSEGLVFRSPLIPRPPNAILVLANDEPSMALGRVAEPEPGEPFGRGQACAAQWFDHSQRCYAPLRRG
jgi:hypothetical protein